MLHELALDPDIVVRAAVAINGACGPEIDAILAGDSDERVRALLGCRIARLLPGLGPDDHDSAARHVRTTLAALARDHAIRVRAAIAREIKIMATAPHNLVLLLAQDEAIAVSDPIIRLSPVLTDADLLMLLATPPHPAAAESIASRPGLSAAVSDAIAEHADAPAIRTLLANPSACIREATLDALVGRAPYHAEWHGPLVRRPRLSTRAVRTLAQFVAADLLAILTARTDLGPAALDAARHLVAAELCSTGLDDGDDDLLLADCKRLKAAGQLTEQVFLEAAQAGDRRRAVVCLAVASGVPVETVDRVIDLRSAKAIVSLAARAGFTMRAGLAAQAVLGQLGPDSILRSNQEGGFPLSDDEVEWQIELYGELSTPLAKAGAAWPTPTPAHVT